jgi:hypothetical protein
MEITKLPTKPYKVAELQEKYRNGHLKDHNDAINYINEYFYETPRGSYMYWNVLLNKFELYERDEFKYSVKDKVENGDDIERYYKINSKIYNVINNEELPRLFKKDSIYYLNESPMTQVIPETQSSSVIESKEAEQIVLQAPKIPLESLHRFLLEFQVSDKSYLPLNCAMFHKIYLDYCESKQLDKTDNVRKFKKDILELGIEFKKGRSKYYKIEKTKLNKLAEENNWYLDPNERLSQEELQVLINELTEDERRRVG